MRQQTLPLERVQRVTSRRTEQPVLNRQAAQITKQLGLTTPADVLAESAGRFFAANKLVGAR